MNPQEAEQYKLKRKLDVGNYNQEMIKLDEDHLTNLVLEVNYIILSWVAR